MISVGLTSVGDVIACSLMYELNEFTSYMLLVIDLVGRFGNTGD